MDNICIELKDTAEYKIEMPEKKVKIRAIVNRHFKEKGEGMDDILAKLINSDILSA